MERCEIILGAFLAGGLQIHKEGYGYECVLDLVKVILLLTQLLLKQVHEQSGNILI